ncbi:MAG: tRNA lysidine(34) synthetase TilS [Candidatus Bruticola sp.]
MHSLATCLHNFLQLNEFIPQGSHCLLAVSGGSDSTALLHLLHELRHSFNLTIYAAHFDHQLRPESGDDRLHTEELCRSLGIKCFTRIKPIAEIAAAKSLSLEEAGRTERYAFFTEIQQKHDIPYLLTAHTADDLAETVLMRLISGTGTVGLGAIRPQTRRGRFTLLRPLLIFRKHELCSYLKDIGLTWREDATNHVADAPRTKVRLCLLPLLEKWNTQIVDSLGRLALSAQEDEDYFTNEVQQLWQAGALLPQEDNISKPYKLFIPTEPAGPCVGFNRNWLRELHPALRKRLWRFSQTQILSQLGKKKEKVWPLESCHYQALEHFLSTANGKRLPLLNGLQVRWEQDILWWESNGENEQPPLLPDLSVSLTNSSLNNLLNASLSSAGNNVPSPQSQNELEWLFPLRNLKLTLRRAEISQRPEPLKIWLNPQALAEKLNVCPILTLRSRLPGDSFFPSGGCGRQKLKKYLLGAGIPQRERDYIPLLCCGSHIIWAVGLKADQNFLAKPGQTNVISLQAAPINDQSMKGLK